MDSRDHKKTSDAPSPSARQIRRTGTARAWMLASTLSAAAGCSPTNPPPSPTESATPPGPIGMPNPASVHCIRQGGSLIPQRDATGGEYALCALPDGSRCEEWALFRGECGSAPANKP